MAKLCALFVLALVLIVHANARNIPNSTNNSQEGKTNVVNVSKAMPPHANVKDKKCGVVFAGVGGIAGVGGVAGVIPLGGIGGLGGIGSGVGGLGGGVGGLGGGAGGLGGGVGGLGGILP